MSQIKAKTISEFAKHELPYPIPEWQKGLLNLMKSGGKIVFYQGKRRTNFLNYYLLEQSLEKIEKKPKFETVENKGQNASTPRGG